MTYRSGVARKITGFVMALSVVAAIALSALLIVDAYNRTLDTVVDRVAWRSGDSAQQQLALYDRNAARLEKIAATLLQPAPVVYAGIHDYAGETLLRRFGDGRSPFSPADFSELRSGLGRLDVGRTGRPWAPSGLRFIDITVPVFSPISPSETGLSPQEFALRLANAGAARSQHVMGYYHLGIDREILLQELAPYAGKVALISLLALLGIFLFTTIALRIITAPLARLAAIADEIAKGNIDRNIRTGGSGEVRDIASQLSIILNELRKHKAKVDTDRSLLALKVEERTEQLSKRNRELTEAVKQVTQTKNQLRQLAYYDSLTQLPNRQLFTEQLNMLLRIAGREGGKIALLFLDLDNFKRINDSLGHSAGDALLREVARRLAGCVRESDLLAKYIDSETRIGVSRLGGDEFTVVLNNIDEPATAGAIAQRLLETLQAPITIEGHEIVMTPSIGIALAPQDANRVEDLLKLADTAMYHAKASGRNKYSFYTASMKSAGVGRLKLETELRKAIERGGGDGPDRRYRQLDTAGGRAPGQGAAGAATRTAKNGGQRFVTAVQPEFHRAGTACVGRERRRSGTDGARAHGGRDHEQRQGIRRGAALTQGAGCQPVCGRLWYRLLLPELPEPLPAGQAQDRPKLCDRLRQEHHQYEPGERDHCDGQKSQPVTGSRGCRQIGRAHV